MIPSVISAQLNKDDIKFTYSENTNLQKSKKSFP